MRKRWLLLHGTPLSPQVWDGVRASFGADTVAPDLMKLIPAHITAGAGVQTQIAEAVLSGVPGEDELVVVGHSFGGQVAIEVALLSPRRVTAVIIVCSRHTPCPAFAQSARAIRAGAPVDIEAGLRRWFTSQELAQSPPVVDYVRGELARQPRGPWAASLEAIAAYDRSGAIGVIDAPVSLFAAGRDEVSPPAVMAELADALPCARLHIVDEWAHMSPFVDPSGFAAALRGAVG